MTLTCRTVDPVSAALIAAGHLTIITLPTLPKVIPARLGIHAGTKVPSLGEAAGWDHFDTDTYVATRWPHRNISATPLPTSAIVATANVVDCAPITKPGHCPNPPEDGWADHVSVNPVTGHLHFYRTGHRQPLWAVEDLSEYEPYGDWSPGRWALILDDVQPTTTRCPACWGTCYKVPPTADESRSGVTPWSWVGCAACDETGYRFRGEGHCPPIHTPGRPGFWEWQP